MKNKRIIVTGGCGFIGSHIVERFYNDNEIIVIDNLSSGKQSNLPRSFPLGNLIIGDISQKLHWSIFNKYFKDIDYVFHCAANVLIDESLLDPEHDAMVNVIGLVNVLEACRHNNIKRLVWCSSSAIYGEPDFVPIKESHELKPDSPYAVSKTCGEYYCDLYTSLWGLEIVKLRYFNAYGPRQDVTNPYSGVMALFIDQCMNGKPLTIHGTGQQTRDFVYVKDIARANELAITSPCGAYNVGTGVETSIVDLAHWIRDEVNEVKHICSDITYSEGRLADIMRDHADTSLAESTLKFKAEYSLRKGLIEYLTWRETHEE